VITGVKAKASIRWHHYTAAAIEGYHIAPCNKAGTAWDLVATVVLSDKFKMAQTPLVFVAMRTKKGLDGTCVVKAEWRFPIKSCQLDAHQLTARLGAPEET
jgi:hypothetical protein